MPLRMSQIIVIVVSGNRPFQPLSRKRIPARMVRTPEPSTSLPSRVRWAPQPSANSATPPASSIQPTDSASGRPSISGKAMAAAAIRILRMPQARVASQEAAANCLGEEAAAVSGGSTGVPGRVTGPLMPLSEGGGRRSRG